MQLPRPRKDLWHVDSLYSCFFCHLNYKNLYVVYLKNYLTRGGGGGGGGMSTPGSPLAMLLLREQGPRPAQGKQGGWEYLKKHPKPGLDQF